MSRSWAVLSGTITVNIAVAGISTGYLRLFQSDVRGDLGIDMGQLGVLLGSVSFGALVAQAPGGLLGDRFGVRRTVAAGLALAGLTLMLLSSVRSFVEMLSAMGLFGVASGLIAPNLPKALGMWFRAERLGQVNGLTRAGQGLGNMAQGFWALPVAAYLGGWRPLTTYFGYLVIFLALLWVVVARDAPAGSPRHPVEQNTRVEVAHVLRLKSVWVLTLCIFLFEGGMRGAIIHYIYYLNEVRGMGPQLPGRMFAIASASFMVGCALLPRLSDRIGLRKPFYIVGIMTAAACVLAQAVLSGTLLTLSNVVWGLAASTMTLLVVVPVEMKEVGPRLAGTACGVILTGGSIGSILLMPLGLEFAEHRPVTGFFIFAGCLALSALLFATVRETGPRRGVFATGA